MLKVAGHSSITELYDSVVPHGHCSPLTRRNLPLPLEGNALIKHMNSIAAENRTVEELAYFRGGTWLPHFIPELVPYVMTLDGFMTPYTAYQPEVNQGALEVKFRTQGFIRWLTGQEVAGCGVYDGATATMEAALMAARIRHKDKIIVSGTVDPVIKRVLQTYARGGNIQVEFSAISNGRTDLSDLENRANAAAIIVQDPNFFGLMEPLEEIANYAVSHDSLFVASIDPVTRFILNPPAVADIVVGDGQQLGLPIGFGGPHFGFMATRHKYVRNLPGRIIGKGVDSEGRTAYALTLATREQHIRKENATSNMCTSEDLCLIGAAAFMDYWEGKGMKNLAERCYANAHYLADRLNRVGIQISYNSPFFNQFVASARMPVEELNRMLLQYGIVGGLDIRKYAAQHHDEAILAALDTIKNPMLLSATEIHSKDAMNAFVDALAGKEIAKRSYSSRIFVKSADDIPPRLESTLPQNLREDQGELPLAAAGDLWKYYRQRSEENYTPVSNFYPLGSCTMKANPAINKKILATPGFANISPLQDEENVQGTLRLSWELQEYLGTISGLPFVSLQPMAGAHGELTSLHVIKAHHEHRRQGHRNKVLLPEHAHGTNFASAAMCCYTDIQRVKTTSDGTIDEGDLDKLLDENTAAVMITLPGTFGLYEPDILRIITKVHDAGAHVYVDGANQNALVGRVRYGDLGFDAVQINLHKTYGAPHGTGGPGACAVMVGEELEPFLPVPRIQSIDGVFTLDYERPLSIGMMGASPFGNFLVHAMAYAYIMNMGSEGLKDVSGVAVLNANYLASMLAAEGFEFAFPGPYMHEFILAVRVPQWNGIEPIDVAKGLIDYGIHPPTTSFPLHDGLLIEPTETATYEQMNHFVEAMIGIRRTAQEDPAHLLSAPHSTLVGKVDLVGIDRKANKAESYREVLH
jgi:glycine dehydrogenase